MMWVKGREDDTGAVVAGLECTVTGALGVVVAQIDELNPFR